MAANSPHVDQQLQQSPDLRPSTGMSSSTQLTRIDKRHDAPGGIITARTPSSAGNSQASHPSTPINLKEGADRTMDQNGWRNVRTLPTWVQRREEDEAELIAMPPKAQQKHPERPNHDAMRETTPVTTSPIRENATRWRNFVQVTAYPPGSALSEKIDPAWLSQQADLDSPWMASNRDVENEGDGSADDADVKFHVLPINAKRRRIWYKRIHIMLLNNPMVPLSFRALIWVLSLLALSLACSVFTLSKKYGLSQKPSTIMAILVDVIALVYLIYVTYDEYSGKPLGLRSPKAKMRLIMLDLLFIIFDSANLSLAFDTLFDTRWSCKSAVSAEDFITPGTNMTITIDPICDRQRALTTFLFLALCGWISTFTISVFRLVERVSSSSRS